MFIEQDRANDGIRPHYEEWRIMFIEISIGIGLIAGIVYYRWKFRQAVLQHREACVVHQRMLLCIMSGQVESYFRDSMVTNHVVRLNKGKIEILIGNNDHLIPVDMGQINDPSVAFDNAYNKFMEYVR